MNQSFPIQADLDQLVVITSEWLRAEQSRLEDVLSPLSPEEAALASSAGVLHPDRVRLGRLPAMPVPDHPTLATVAATFGMFTPAMTALAAGYMVLLRSPGDTRELLAHELRLVHHCEAAGSLENYIAKYLKEVIEWGYGRTPMELDAERFAKS